MMSVLSENHPYQIKQFIKISKNTKLWGVI